MGNQLFIKLFRFNPKTDYLPYYKQHTIITTKDDTFVDLLDKLNTLETFSYKGTEEFGIKVNNLFVTLNTPIQEIVKQTSNELIIEPVSSYRAIHDLTINNDDFITKLALFEKYLTQKQRQIYAKELQLYYYASNSLNFHKDYIGDHCAIIASDLIESRPELKDELYTLLSNKQTGIWYHTSLMKRIHNIDESLHEKIEKILLDITKEQHCSHMEYLDDITDIAQEFKDFNIAVHDKKSTGALKKIVQNSKATLINTFTQNEDLAFHSLHADENFTYQLAGQVLLDALDNNADFLIVNDAQSFTLFDTNQKEISKVVGRDINLPIVTAEQFNQMLNGEKDQIKLGFNKHKVSISFL
jgi:hypothetical protein